MASHDWVTRVCLGVVGTGLFLGSAYAAKICEEADTLGPGIDVDGNISVAVELQGPFHCRICVNTKNNKFRKKCEGEVVNESGENQKYRNAPIFAVPGQESSLYKVKESGAAKLTTKGTVNL